MYVFIAYFKTSKKCVSHVSTPYTAMLTEFEQKHQQKPKRSLMRKLQQPQNQSDQRQLIQHRL